MASCPSGSMEKNLDLRSAFFLDCLPAGKTGGLCLDKAGFRYNTFECLE